MPNEINYLETFSLDPCYNLAFEEYILKKRLDGDYLLLWQNDNAIVIGKNQNAEAEINREFVDEHHIKVVRRMTGGGAVYHDLGNLNYSFITDVLDAEKITMERFTKPIVNALKKLSLDARSSGRNDILVDGKKVSGTAQCIIKNRILHHGTLLFDSNPELISGALNADPLKFKDKSIKSVKSRVGNIKDNLKQDMSLNEFWEIIKRELTGRGLREIKISDRELSEIKKLKETKYDTWEWNFGHSPSFDFINKKRFKGGSLEVGLHAEKDFIKEICFYGDFLAVAPLEPLCEALKETRFVRADVEKKLDQFPLWEMFGGITKDEVLETMFKAG